MGISGKTFLCAVIGDPIEHSLSPTIQNAAFNTLGLDFVFTAFTVKPSNVTNALSGIRALGIVGVNVTMPHKEAVVQYLDWTDASVKRLNSVNTIHCKEGKLLGYSTDGIGALKALKENGADPYGKRVLLLGAGGAARAIAYALIHEVDELVILNRTVFEVKMLSETLKMEFNKKISVDSFAPSVITEKICNTDILINATPVGMNPYKEQSLVAQSSLKSDLTVMDIVYSPVETKLAKDAKVVGAKVISGVEMLIYQGAASFEIWTGHKAPVQVMREAVLEQLNKRQSACEEKH
ncbi:MAG: shikimate dehydrogenase [Candidatus Bathyarchaeota archaeon]|nr:shikimate dehydrogenase [Candidatus Termiticorpusculum sp.]